MRVKITKRAEVAGGAPAREMADHIPGKVQPAKFSLPVDYVIEGVLQGQVTIGESVIVQRDTRNGVKMPGIFQTSPVTSWDGKTFHTRNSVYDFEVLSQ
jgi:hypothetical protein